jgi:hypothetical protein
LAWAFSDGRMALPLPMSTTLLALVQTLQGRGTTPGLVASVHSELLRTDENEASRTREAVLAIVRPDASMHRWSPNELERSIEQIDWSLLRGAYGPSHRSSRGDHVGATLLALARGADDDDVLLGHVWHQESIFPVTAVTTPFLRYVLLRSRGRAQKVREALWAIHDSAATLGTDNWLAASIFEATTLCLGPPRAWTFDDDSEFSQLIRVAVPQWRAE